MKAFENRIKKGKKTHPLKPSKCDIIIKKLDEEMTVWTREGTTKAKYKFADSYFAENVLNPEIKTDPRNWHKSLQIFSRYKNNTGLLNTTSGPVADIHQWKEAQEGKREWETVE